MHQFLLVLRCVLVTLSIASAAPLPAQEPAPDPVAAYRAFVSALANARSLDDLFPYVPASARAKLSGVPAEMVPQVLDRLRGDAGQRPPEWTVVQRAQNGDRARLVLRGHRVEGRARVGLEATVDLQREDDGWKVESEEPWRQVEVLPVDRTAGSELPPRGPGADDSGRPAFDPVGYRSVGQAAGSGDAWDGSVVFDPRGRYVALANNRNGRIGLFDLGSLEERWSAQVPHAYGTLSFRPDGRGFAIVGESGWVPEVLPLAANLARGQPDRGYFFSTPVLAEAAAAIEGRPDWTTLAYHPRLPILAIGLGDHEDETRGAIVFQPAGEGLWMPGKPEPPPVWRTTRAPQSLRWAPGGERIAWLSSGREPGSPIFVRGYPQDEAARALSRADFAPGRIALGPGGRLLAAMGAVADEVTVIVWNVESGAEVASLPGMARVVFAPDGQHLFAVRDAGVQIEPGVADEILVSRLGAAAPVHTIPAFRSEGQARAVVGLALSPNGRFLIAVSDRGDVRLWDAGGP